MGGEFDSHAQEVGNLNPSSLASISCKRHDKCITEADKTRLWLRGGSAKKKRITQTLLRLKTRLQEQQKATLTVKTVRWSLSFLQGRGIWTPKTDL